MAKTDLRVLGLSVILASGCAGDAPSLDVEGGIGTEADRAALFDEILEKTRDREAWSPFKNAVHQFDPMTEMEAVRGEVVGAQSEPELFRALVKLSNARRDRHLGVDLVEDGLMVPFDGTRTQAPIRFLPDYGDESLHAFFVADIGRPWVGVQEVQVGDRVTHVNGWPIDEYAAALRPYMRYSMIPNLRWQLASWLSQRAIEIPPELQEGETVRYVLERADGTAYEVGAPWLREADVEWAGHDARPYDGFERIETFESFDLHRDDERLLLVLDWHRFGGDLVLGTDWLIEYADAEGLLDYDLIFDATRGRGGSLGAYAIQRLSPKSFKTTFGNLRISDIIEPFVADRRAAFSRREILDSGIPETIDDGTWLLDWLETDVLEALTAGEEYSSTVPFKSTHAPKSSDGVLDPAPVHFRGEMVVLLGPNGGSHLDQFASIIADNDLATIIGMPAGGYSNTWEWDEVLTLPSGQPLVRFMWNIGHTVRPNGEILEGNPADVDEFIPLTRENHLGYHDGLMRRAFEILGRG